MSMQKVTATVSTQTQTYVHCLHCNHTLSTVDHLFESAQASPLKTQGFGPWYCDQCGHGYVGHVDAKKNVFLDPTPRDRKQNALAVLQHKNLLLLVEGMEFDGRPKANSPQERHEGNQYYYEEHNCPTNYLRHTNRIIQLPNDIEIDWANIRSIQELKDILQSNSIDADPHGLFSLVFVEPIGYGTGFDEAVEAILSPELHQ